MTFLSPKRVNISCIVERPRNIMSFLDNPKNAGTALWIIGIVNILLGVIGLVAGAVDDETSTTVAVVGGVGTIIVGLIYFGFGKDIRAGVVSDKWDIVCRFVMTTAIVIFVSGIFGYDGNTNDWVGSIVGGIIIALIVYWVYKHMTDNKVDTLDKILWFILVIVMVLSLLGNLLTIVAFPIGTIEGICGVVISLFLLIALFDNDVKSRMGM